MLPSSVEPSFQSVVHHWNLTPLQFRLICGVPIVVALYAGLQWYFERDAKRYLSGLHRRREARRKREQVSPVINPTRWGLLEEKAQWVVDEVQGKLPSDVKGEAESVPVLFDESRETSKGIVALGLYCAFTPNHVSASKGPIILYLRNIERFCAQHGEDFETQVRATYLHELGHHFGWGEKEVEERGL